ncbi:Putrescine hydroxycinnamoyltransferase 3 [Linum grandiflorum]
MALIYAYRPPTPSNAVIELGLRKALATYRVMAGQLGEDKEKGNPVIFLNDNGVKFVEASVDGTLDELLPFEFSPALLDFHPPLKGAKEVTLVQLTRFACGSLVFGWASHHYVADGYSASHFLAAWGRAAREVESGPVPFCADRSIFKPRAQSKFEFDHIGAEYKSKRLSSKMNGHDHFPDPDVIVPHKVHFTLDFVTKLKAEASASKPNDVGTRYSTFVTLVAHLWRATTKARQLDRVQTTSVRISVDGRNRLNHPDSPVPPQYFGNLVLWAFPMSRVDDLVNNPLGYAAKLIHDAIKRVDGRYFRSFIDFATQRAEKDPDLVPSADMGKEVLWPDLEVDSWLNFPFYDVDFGGGSPSMFVPSYYPTEGMMFLLPSFSRDGSVDAVVPLFRRDLAAFKQVCYTL